MIQKKTFEVRDKFLTCINPILAKKVSFLGGRGANTVVLRIYS